MTADMTDSRIEKLEETAAHLARLAEELSDIVARQEREIAVLTRRVQMLMEREAQREADAGGGGAEVVGDTRPPHW
jgi:SlyX protein